MTLGAFGSNEPGYEDPISTASRYVTFVSESESR